MDRKLRGGILLLILILFSALTLSGCSLLLSGNVQSLKVDSEEVTVYFGEETQLKYSISPATHKEVITFTSSDESVVTVNSIGRVKGIGIGTAVITIETNVTDTTAKITVNVTYAPVSAIVVSSTGELNQLSGTATAVQFSASAGEHCDPAEVFNWNVAREDGKAVAFSGGEGTKTFEFTPLHLGVTYIITATSGEGEEMVVSNRVKVLWSSPVESVSIAASSTPAIMGVALGINAAITPSTARTDGIDWFYKLESSTTWQDGALDSDSVFSFMATSHGNYQIKAIVYNGNVPVESNVITITADYAPVMDVSVSTSADVCTTRDGVNFEVMWNKRYVDPDTTYAIIWYVNNVRQPAYDNKTKIDAHRFTAAGIYNVFVTVNGVSSAASGGAVRLSVVEEFDAVTAVAVSTGVADNQKVSASGSAIFTANFGNGVYDPDSIVKWYVNDVCKQSDTSTTYTMTYAVGSDTAAEYHVKAVVGNVESNTYTIATRGVNSTVSNDFFDAYHYYGGYPQNTYITSEEELKNVLSYARETRKASLEIYVDYQPELVLTNGSGDSKLRRALNAYEEAGNSPLISTAATGSSTGKVTMTFDYTDASVAQPVRSGGFNTDEVSCQIVINKPYKSATGRAASAPLPVDDFPVWNEPVTTSNLLYKVVDWGFKPTFANTTGAAYLVYEAAKEVLRDIIDDDMTDYEKTLAIYDWICYNVLYDYELASLTFADLGVSDDKTYLNAMMKFSGYYLEGALLDRKAVCDGKSKAFTLLCAMEDIDTVRITGAAASQAGGAAGNHAWNKVLIDADDNDVLEWYFVDSTWGDTGTTASCGHAGHTRNEILLHKYFLLSDTETAATHEEESRYDYPDAVNNFDYYVNTKIGSQSLYVTNQSTLRAIASAATAAGLTAVEIRISSSYAFENIFEELSGSGYFNRSYNIGDVYILYKV